MNVTEIDVGKKQNGNDLDRNTCDGADDKYEAIAQDTEINSD